VQIQQKYGAKMRFSVPNLLKTATQLFLFASGLARATEAARYYYPPKDVSRAALKSANIAPWLANHCDYDCQEEKRNLGLISGFDYSQSKYNDSVDYDFFSLESLLTGAEINDPELMNGFMTTIVYKQPPKKLPKQSSKEMQKYAKQELEYLCATKARIMNITEHNGCVSLPLLEDQCEFNSLDAHISDDFNSNKYPHLFAFFNFVGNFSSEGDICFHNSDHLKNTVPLWNNKPYFHIDDNHVANIHTHNTASTMIIPEAATYTIDFDKFDFKQRMWHALHVGKFEFSRMGRMLRSIKVTTTDEQRTAIEAQVDAMIEDIEATIREEYDLRVITNTNFQSYNKLNSPQVTYLPSGGVYALNYAVHSSPIRTAENVNACRVFMSFRPKF
jgi:hypothetical protein